ncbi:protein Abitram-like [Liolophura sinensis]|uniref:protein Abitram-like n=1 Tax=Liolophura sinensis TaxID=3198878 RepID=UPI0031596BE4
MENDLHGEISLDDQNKEETDTVKDRKEHLSVVDRYYTRKYKTDVQGNISHDQCILLHSNKVCVVTVAKSHPVLAENKTITSVNFQVDGGPNRMENKVSGKGKRGAQKMKADSPVCYIHCDDGSAYTLYSCVRGMLIEVNKNLVSHPSLISEKPETDGYLAIILPPLKEYHAVVSKLDGQEKYLQTLQQRQQPTPPPDAAMEDGPPG